MKTPFAVYLLCLHCNFGEMSFAESKQSITYCVNNQAGDKEPETQK